jgi:Domain of unknown function (DUF4166)
VASGYHLSPRGERAAARGEEVRRGAEELGVPLKFDAGESGAGLYERLMGAGWRELCEPVRRLHTRRAGLCGEGRFEVRGGGLLARAAARLLGLPRVGGGVRVCLYVTREGERERWHRTFEGRAFDTLQQAREDGLLAERSGPFELLFRLSADGGALVYTQAGAALRLGRLRVPLPRAIAPRVEGHESASEDGRGVSVCVKASAPLFGRMLSYEGRLETKGDAATAGAGSLSQS